MIKIFDVSDIIELRPYDDRKHIKQCDMESYEAASDLVQSSQETVVWDARFEMFTIMHLSYG